MKSLSSPIRILIAVISVTLICSCSAPKNQQANLNANNPQKPSPSESTSVPIDRADDRRPQLKSYTSNVSWKSEGDEQFVPLLNDDQWHILPDHALVNTDENGEGVLSINGCLLVHVFRSS